MFDWQGVLRELRLLAQELQTDRFYAIYLSALIGLVAYVFK